MDVQTILNSCQLNNGQLSLTHVVGASEHEKIYQATGTLYDFENKKYIFKETDFTEFNDMFKNTYLHDIYQTIENIGRFRIMVMNGPACYTLHRDYTKRYHMALKTNENCHFVFPTDNEIVHIPDDGNVHLVDTTHWHTFLNGSREQRIHLVMDDISTYTL